MKVSFVIPPPLDNASVRDYAGGLGFEKASTYVLPPLDMLQLAAIAELEHEIQFHDFSWHKHDFDIIGNVLGFCPDVIITQASLPSIYSDLEFSRKIRNTGVRTLCRLIHMPDNFLQTIKANSNDEWLIGECENTLLSILSGKSNLGLLSGSTDNSLRPPPPTELDALPYPARHTTLQYNYE